jgi:hypothetical protein
MAAAKENAFTGMRKQKRKSKPIDPEPGVNAHSMIKGAENGYF